MALTYELIASQVLTSNTIVVQFAALPSTYTDLVVRMSINRGGGTNTILVYINGSSATYTDNVTRGISTAVTNLTNSGLGNANFNNSAAGATNSFSNNEFYFPNYAGTNKKSYSALTNQPANSTTQAIGIWGSHWTNLTQPITQLEFSGASLSTLLAGSSFYIYGIKNS